MATHRSFSLLLLLLAGSIGSAYSQGPGIDLYGDPLPTGASSRLGSLRLRGQGVPAGIQFSLDGRTLASQTSSGITMADVASGRMLEPVERQVVMVRVGSDRELQIERGRVFLVGESKRRAEFRREFRWKGFSRDGESFAFWKNKTDRFGKQIGGNSLQIWDTTNGKLKREIKSDVEVGRASAEFSPDGRFVVVRGGKHIVLFDLDAGTQRTLLSIKGNGMGCYAISHDGKRLAFAEFYAGVTTVVELATGKTLFSLPEDKFTRTVAFAADGRIAHGGEQGKMHIWSADGKQKLREITIKDNVFAIDFSPDGKLIAVISALFRQNQTRLFEVATGRELHVTPRHEQRIDTLAYSSDGKRIVSGAVDKTIRIWDATTGKQLGVVGTNTPSDERGQARASAISPDGKTLIVAGGKELPRGRRVDDEILFCDATTGEVMRRTPGPEGHIFALAYTPDGRSIISLSVDREIAPEATDKLFHHYSIHVRDAETGELRLRLPRLTDRYSRRLVVSPNGELAATLPQAEEYMTTTIVSLKTGTVLKQLKTRGLAFSPDGKHIATTGRNRVYLWDVATWQSRELVGPYSYKSLAFSPNGRYLAATGSTSSNTGISVFDIRSGEIVWKTTDVGWKQTAVAFSPDGQSIVSVCDAITAVVWKLDLRAE